MLRKKMSMRKPDWVPNKPVPKKTKIRFVNPPRLSIPELQKKVARLEVRCRVGADRVLFMKAQGDLRANLAEAFLGQLQAERDKLKKELTNALAWKEAGWED